MSSFSISKVGDLNIAVSDSRAISYEHSDGTEYIYVFAGSGGGGGRTATIQRFDPNTGNVENWANFPEKDSHKVVGYINGKFYTAAGHETDKCYEVNPETGDITQVGTLSDYNELADHMGAVLNGYLYFWGGVYGSSLNNDNLNVYRMDTSGSISNIGTMDSEQFDGAGANVEGTIYSIGGGDRNGVNSNVYEVGSGGSWSSAGNLTKNGSDFPLRQVRGTVVSGLVWFVGGRTSGGTALSDVHRFGTDWVLEEVGDVSRAIYDTQAAYHSGNDAIYELGGLDSNGNVRTEIYEIKSSFQLSTFLYESGRRAKLGNASQSYVHEGGSEDDLVTDNGDSSYAFISGNGMGRES